MRMTHPPGDSISHHKIAYHRFAYNAYLVYRWFCLVIAPVNVLLNYFSYRVFLNAAWNHSLMSRMLKYLSVCEVWFNLVIFIREILPNSTSIGVNFVSVLIYTCVYKCASLAQVFFLICRNWTIVFLAGYRYDTICNSRASIKMKKRSVKSGATAANMLLFRTTAVANTATNNNSNNNNNTNNSHNNINSKKASSSADPTLPHQKSATPHNNRPPYHQQHIPNFPGHRPSTSRVIHIFRETTLFRVMLTVYAGILLAVLPRAFERTLIFPRCPTDMRRETPLLLRHTWYIYVYQGALMFLLQNGGPFIIVIVLSSFVIRKIWKLRRFRQTLNVTLRNKLAGDKLIMAMCLIFFIFEMPSFFSKLLDTPLENAGRLYSNIVLGFVGNFCIILDSFTNIFIYIFSNPTFVRISSVHWRRLGHRLKIDTTTRCHVTTGGAASASVYFFTSQHQQQRDAGAGGRCGGDCVGAQEGGGGGGGRAGCTATNAPYNCGKIENDPSTNHNVDEDNLCFLKGGNVL